MQLRNLIMLGACTAVLAGPSVAQDEHANKMEIQESYNAGVRLYQNRKWYESREEWKNTLKLDPKHWNATWMTAMSYTQEGNPSASLPWYRKASDLQPQHFMAAFETGVTFMRYKDSDKKAFEKALPYLERARTARAGGKGLSTDEKDQKMRDFLIGPALVELYFHLKKKDKARSVAEAEMRKQPLSSIPCYYLGVLAEESDDRDRAINLYKAGAKAKLESPFNSVFHKWGLEDKRQACNQRARFLDSTMVRYGEVRDNGLTFIDGEKEMRMMLPHPKLLKLKKGQRYPWIYMFPPHVEKAGSVITHVASAVCQSNSVGGTLEVEFTVHGGAHNLNLNTKTAGSAKLVEAGKFANSLFRENTNKMFTVSVKKKKKPRKAGWGRGYKGFMFSYNGKDKQHVDNYKAQPKNYTKPPVWEHHWYVVKAKKYTFWVHVKARDGFWKKRQREIQFMLRELRLP